MPLYDYQCTQCKEITEVRHGFDDVHSDPCPKCGAPLKRLFNPAGIVFKGSGFYINDSRKAESKSDSGGASASSESSSTASSPAPAAPAPGPTKESAA